MKIFYVAFVRLPTEKAHGLQIMKVCEALAEAGASVELLIPGRKTTITEDPYTYYGVEKNFKITTLPGPDLMGWGHIGFLVSQLLFGWRTAVYTRRRRDAVVMSQDEWTLGPLRRAGHTFVYEVHNGRSNPQAQRAAREATLLVANSTGTKQFYVGEGIPESKIMVCPNGVDTERFNPKETKEEARDALGLPRDRKLIVYTGHLYDWKGADTLARAAHELPEGTTVVFVGGTERDVASFRTKYGSEKHILLLGHKPNREIPLFLRAADVLVLPNDRVGESERFTSPMKLFEYLAAGKPIVASDLPSIREVVDERSAYLFTAGDETSLAAVLTAALFDTAGAEERATHARALAAHYTWNREPLVRAIESRL